MDENKDLFETENRTEQGVSGETFNEEQSVTEDAVSNNETAEYETGAQAERAVSEDETNNKIPQFETDNESELNDTESVSDGQDAQNESETSEDGFYNVELSEEELEEEAGIAAGKKKTSAVIVASFAVLAVVAIVIILIVVIKSGKGKDGSTDMSSSGTTADTYLPTEKVDEVSGTDSVATDADTADDTPSQPIDYTDYGVTVTLGDYKNLSFNVPAQSVTDEELDEEVASFLNTLTEIRDVTDRPAQAGDTVKIDFDGIVDGEHHDSTTGTDFEVTIGSKRTITGFEDGIIDMSIGETKVLNLTFPDPYTNPDFAGKPVDFSITLKSIRAPFVPELTDELVAENTDYETVEAFLENTKADLLVRKTEDATESAFEAAIDELVNKCTFSSEVEKEIADRIEYYRRYYDSYFMQYFGVDALTYSSMTQEQYDEMLRSISEPEVKYPYIYKEIARAEGYTPSEEEKAAQFKSMFYDMYGFESEEDIYKTFTKRMCDVTVEYELLSRYGYNYLRKSLGLSTLEN